MLHYQGSCRYVMSETCESMNNSSSNLTAFRVESKHVKGTNRAGRRAAYIRDLTVIVYGVVSNTLYEINFKLGKTNENQNV